MLYLLSDLYLSSWTQSYMQSVFFTGGCLVQKCLILDSCKTCCWSCCVFGLRHTQDIVEVVPGEGVLSGRAIHDLCHANRGCFPEPCERGQSTSWTFLILVDSPRRKTKTMTLFFKVGLFMLPRFVPSTDVILKDSFGRHVPLVA